MQYENIIWKVYSDFSRYRNLKLLQNYQILIDSKTNRGYFKNEADFEDIVIGVISKRGTKNFLCIGLISREFKQIPDSFFFVHLIENTNQNNIFQMYIEQALLSPRKEKRDIEEELLDFGMSADIIQILKKQQKNLYQLLQSSDEVCLPNYLQVKKKNIIERKICTKNTDGHSTYEINDIVLSDQRNLFPLNRGEKEAVDLIYRKMCEYEKQVYSDTVLTNPKEFVLVQDKTKTKS